eukprot:NODE_217_length_12479_cov_0.651212.p9 type:complete len:163 gc:universal NODE_217_length_12479_cov_0.651212:5819-5331(-)
MHELHSTLRPYSKKIQTLDNFTKISHGIYSKSLDQYVQSMLKKSFGKLFEFFDKLEAAKLNCPPHELSYQAEFSKPQAKRILNSFSLKEFKKAVESIYKKVEKQFSEHGLLLQVVWRSFQEGILFQHERISKNLVECYPNSGIDIEFGIPDVLQVISDMARV